MDERRGSNDLTLLFLLNINYYYDVLADIIGLFIFNTNLFGLSVEYVD